MRQAEGDESAGIGGAFGAGARYTVAESPLAVVDDDAAGFEAAVMERGVRHPASMTASDGFEGVFDFAQGRRVSVSVFLFVLEDSLMASGLRASSAVTTWS